jgi:hypothetical protein
MLEKRAFTASSLDRDRNRNNHDRCKLIISKHFALKVDMRAFQFQALSIVSSFNSLCFS